MNRQKSVRLNLQPSASSFVREENKETLPIDLIIEILSRLPAKSIAVFHSVSKLWSSLLRSQEFTESFQIRSSTQPRLLFTFELDGKWHFFSSLHDKGSSVVVADYHKHLSRNSNYDACQSVNGLIYILDEQSLPSGKRNRVPVICNPCTGQTLTLPKIRARNNNLFSYFGYDPVKKQYKVLCMTVSRYRQQINSREHQVLTLGNGKLKWRKIECLFLHFPEHRRDISICIDGVLYYIAVSDMTRLIACFDFRSEKFSYIDVGLIKFNYNYVNGLINYKGKIGVLGYGELWVLDDREKEKWSKHMIALQDTTSRIINSRWAADNGEIVWILCRSTSPFYVFYYNLERKSVRKVEIKGIEEKLLMGRKLEPYFTVTEHVENLMFL